MLDFLGAAAGGFVGALVSVWLWARRWRGISPRPARKVDEKPAVAPPLDDATLREWWLGEQEEDEQPWP